MFRQTIYVVKKEATYTWYGSIWENIRAFTIKEDANKFVSEHRGKNEDWEIDEVILERS